MDAIATSVITNVVKDPAGAAIVGARVVARLIPAPAFRTADGSEVEAVKETVTDGTGTWSLTLEETAGISPSNSVYEVVEYLPSGARSHIIQVGAADASLFSSLVTPAPPFDGATYLTQASADARYQALSALGGSPVAVDHSAASDGVSTAAARADHKHALASGFRIPIVCTAATRPAAPSEGDLIYETDTDKVLVRISASWVPIGNHRIVTSATRPATTFEGLSIFETDTDKFYAHNGSAWLQMGGFVADTFTPQLAQNGNRTSSTAIGRYMVFFGKWCFLHIRNVCSNAGTAGNQITINNIPAAIAPLKTGQPNGPGDTSYVGTGYVLDNGTAFYPATTYFSNSTTICLYDASGALGINIGVNPSFALASGDALGVDIFYELA